MEVENWFDYVYDGRSEIRDGDDDIFDGGNRVRSYPWLNIECGLTEGKITSLVRCFRPV